MTAGIANLRIWLNKAKEKGATHIIIMCDTFDYSDYPIYVMPNQDAKEEVDKHDGKKMAKLMEVYNVSMPWGPQLKSETLVRNY